MNRILAALVNGAVLSALVTAAVWLVLRLVPRSVLNAATRYVLWWATMAIAIALPAWYLPIPRLQHTEFPAAHIIPPNAGSALVAQAVSPAAVDNFSNPYSNGSASLAATALSQAPSLAWPFPIEITASDWPRLVLTGWLVISLLLLIRLAASYILLDRSSRRSFNAPATLDSHVERWLALCGSKRRGVRLAGSAEIATPVAVGPRHPSILIPARLLDELGDQELQQVGLHEAAHLARYDDYALIVQRIVEALLVFHPVVRWITRRIDLEREIACDDLVIASTGQPRSYAACLTRLVEFRSGVRSSLAAAGAASETSHLARRVDALLDKARHGSTHLLKARLTAMIAMLAALVWIAGKSPAFVAFAKPLAHAIRQTAPLLFPTPMMARTVEEPQNAAPDFEGRVIEDSSGNPMASAELRFHKAGVRELAADLDTDREGRIRVSGLPTGDYTVEVVKPNYIPTSLKLRVPTVGLVVRLVRFAAISGQVLDQQGQPVPGAIHAPGGRTIGGARISLLVKGKGSDELRPVRDGFLGEGGQYRIYDLTPGEYCLGVWYDGLKDGSGVQLYPDNAHPRFFTVSGGEEFSNIDFQIQPRASYQISGKVEAPGNGQTFALALGLPDQPAFPIAQALTEVDGSFRFEKVPMGTYDLFIGGPSVGYGMRTTLLGKNPLYGRMRIQVGGQNVDGIQIKVDAGKSLPVVLHAHGSPEGSSAPPQGCPQNISVSAVSLEPWGLIPLDRTQVTFGKQQTILNLAPGLFRIEAVELPAGCYQVRPAVVDLRSEITVPAALELASAGSIRGALRSGDARASDFSVVLLDADSAGGAQAQLAFPDAEGRFGFQGLRPGRYRIAAQATAQASRSRWIGDVSRMLEIEVAGGAPTNVDLPIAVKEGKR